jgi:hypothetical protein
MTTDEEIARDQQHDAAIENLKALLKTKREAQETYSLHSMTPRDGLTLEKELMLDIDTRKSCNISVIADDHYNQALDAYTAEFGHE